MGNEKVLLLQSELYETASDEFTKILKFYFSSNGQQWIEQRMRKRILLKNSSF